MVLACLLAGAPAAHAAGRVVPSAFYGVMWDRDAALAPAAEQEGQWALMARSGVESTRTVFLWSNAQPQAGMAFDFTETDRLVAMAARHRVDLLPVVRSTPEWAARGTFQHGSPPARISDYTAYLRALVLRYGPRGSFWTQHPELPRRPQRVWQVWNEPHFTYYWATEGRPRTSWAPEYARLLKASYRTIKSADRGATVVLAGLADLAWRHLARLNRYGIRGYYDVAALNFFTAKPANVIKGARLFRSALRRGGAARTPLWLTEATWPAGVNRVPAPAVAWQRAWYTTDAGMATRLGALYATAVSHRRELRLKRVYWYTWASGYTDPDLFDYTGLVRLSGGVFTPRKSLAAYARSARRYERCTKTSAGLCAR